MPHSRHRRCAIAVVSVGLVLGVTAGCSGDDSSSSGSGGPTAASSPTTMDPTAELVGSGCSSYMASNPAGAGSIGAMSLDPVATAASNNPLLTTLSKSISGQLNPRVDMTETLNSSQFTVFAPVDAAFAKIPAAQMDLLKTDGLLLTKILAYHVIQGQLKPSEVTGTHKTVEGADVTVSGSGNSITVDGSSSVICGGIKTSNATVYLIDTVLMPPA